MPLDALTLAALADELRDSLVGGRVQAVVPVNPLTLALEIYHGRRDYLLLSADPQTARVHLTEEKGRRGVEKETPFLLMARKYLKGARLAAISTPKWERIIVLDFEGAEGPSRLVAEIMGRLSNLILLDASNTIRDSLRRITPEMTRARVVLPRQPYIPPPPIERPAPDEVAAPQIELLLAGAAADRPVWRTLLGGLRGLSPLAAREIAHRALGDAEATVGEVERLSTILTAMREVCGPLVADGGDWAPSQVREDDAVVEFAPYALTHLGGEPAPSLSDAVAAFYSRQVGRDSYAAARRRVQALLDAAIERAERQRAALEREVLPTETLEQRRVWGEWLLAYAASVSPGAREFTIADTGEGPLTIPLDPTLTAVENAQRMFRDYERSKRAAADIEMRRESVDIGLAMLRQLATDLALAENRPEIDAVHAQVAALVGERPPTTRGGARPAPPIEVTSPDGLTILVGRNSRQNEHVTFERAAGHDLWLHARAVPGAHVIVKTEGHPALETTVEAAASLAAYYSAARGSTSVAVDVTEVRRVRRLKGGGPGLVTYSGERTLHVAPRAADEFE
ncbi:MAG: NFACT RNA binding domain-containing protein [Anaerolineae bacterium]